MENLPPDPLLKAGAFIDPSYDDSTSAYPDPKPSEPSTPVHCSFAATATAANSDATPGTNSLTADADAPDWLPPGWKVEFRMRSTGATAGQRDKDSEINGENFTFCILEASVSGTEIEGEATELPWQQYPGNNFWEERKLVLGKGSVLRAVL